MEFKQVIATLCCLGNRAEETMIADKDLQAWYMLHAQQVYNWWVGVVWSQNKWSNAKYLLVEIAGEDRDA